MAVKTTAERLAEAREAYHAIITGQAVSRFVDQNGESISYSRTNLGQLSAYIAKLEQELANPSGSQYRGPLRFTFGRRTF